MRSNEREMSSPKEFTVESKKPKYTTLDFIQKSIKFVSKNVFNVFWNTLTEHSA